MTGGLVVLALLMAAVTYPSRAVPLLAPAFDRLPARASSISGWSDRPSSGRSPPRRHCS